MNSAISFTSEFVGLLKMIVQCYDASESKRNWIICWRRYGYSYNAVTKKSFRGTFREANAFVNRLIGKGLYAYALLETSK